MYNVFRVACIHFAMISYVVETYVLTEKRPGRRVMGSLCILSGS